MVCVVVCDSYLSEKTYGEKGANVRATTFTIQTCTSFVVGRMIGWEGAGGNAPCGTVQGYF